MFAARELYRKAIVKSGLSLKNDAQSLVREIAKQHAVKVTEVNVEIEIDDPRQAIREFKNSPREADIVCLRATMDRLDTDLAAMKQRANAWAAGDLDGLRSLPYVDQNANLHRRRRQRARPARTRRRGAGARRRGMDQGRRGCAGA